MSQFLFKGSDDAKLRRLMKLAERKAVKGREAVHLQIESQQTLRMLQTQDMNDDVRRKLEVHAFSFEELWAQQLFLSLPNRESLYKPLDYEPITPASRKRVHLVVFGMNSLVEAVVRQAALIAHYPNYVHDNSLKTIITVVNPGLDTDNNLLTRRWAVLFENSLYRYTDADGDKLVHEPENAHLGAPFTDIEWQFMAGDSGTPFVRDSLKKWSRDPHKLLTIVFAFEDEEKNLDLAQNLPGDYLSEGSAIPVYVRQHTDERLNILSPMPQYKCLRAFGMQETRYDASLPLTQMARSINYIYDSCYHDISDRDGRLSHIERIPHDEAQKLLDGTRAINRFSSEVNAMTIAGKMRSLGYTTIEEWRQLHSLSPEEVDTLSAVEHNRWSMERLLDGVRPVSEEEQKLVEEDISQKDVLKKRGIHYDLRSYEALTDDATGRNVVIYDNALTVNIPLIARTYLEEDKGPEWKTVLAHYKEPPLQMLKPWHMALAGLFLILLFGVGGWFLYRYEKADVLCKQASESSIYLLRVDSVRLQQVDIVNRGTLQQQVVKDIKVIKPGADFFGTAFLAANGTYYTARHCIQYWLYDGAMVVSDPSTWTPEIRLAMQAEAYNRQSRDGSYQRLVCNLVLTNKTDTFYLRENFTYTDSLDKVKRIFPNDGKSYIWRYVEPSFEHENNMRLTDVAKLHVGRPGGLKMLNSLPPVDTKVYILGYPKNEGRHVYQVRTGVIGQVDPEMGFQIVGASVAKGFSGGPVLMKTRTGYTVIGVISHWDKSDEVKSVWAVPLN